MKLSQLTPIESQRQINEVFYGYNHTVKVPDGNFYDMRNLSSDNFPVLSPRPKRGTYISYGQTAPRTAALISKDNLCWVDGIDFYVNGVKQAITLDPQYADTERQLISMGAYVIIMPDRMYINTISPTTDYGNIEAVYAPTTTAGVTYTMCTLSGDALDSTPTVSPNEPADPDNMDLWIDTSQTPHILKQYSASSGMWVQVAATYVKIASANIALGFKELDGVRISGIVPEQLADLNNKTSILYKVSRDEESNGLHDYIVVAGILDEAVSQETAVNVSRRMPAMDFVIECQNRLWGCRYGQDNQGNVVNEIYASKLGDFKNWDCFMGVSTDSYRASCGTDGQFTGAITHQNYPLFWKENVLHKVYGSYPAQYQITQNTCRGVQKGAGKSLAIVNEVLYYKSRNGVCAYDGSLPGEVSYAFGEDHFTGLDDSITDKLRNGAVAGSHGNKYYINMKSDMDGKWWLFVYDTAYQVWHKEDEFRADSFCSCKNEFYYIDHETKHIRTMFGSGTADTEPILWMAETGVLGTSIGVAEGSAALPGKKYIGQLLVRMSLAIGTRVDFYFEYDSDGVWRRVSSVTGRNLRSFYTVLRPRRCDHCRMRIVGVGEAKIFSIAKTIEQGSDL